MSTPDLGSVITSPAARKMIYGAYVVALLVAGALQVAFSSASLSQPNWLVIFVSVIGYLGIPVGGLALANTKPLVAADPLESTPVATDGPQHLAS